MPDQTPPRQLPQLAAWIGVLLALFTAAFTWQSWRDSRDEEIAHLQRLMGLVQRSTDHYFQHLQLGLGALAQDTQADSGLADPPRVQALLARFQRSHPELVLVSLLDLQGRFLAVSATMALDRLPGNSITRDFAAIVASLKPDTPMVLAAPLLGPVSGRWVLPMRYAVRDQQGGLVAFLVATAPVEMLESFWQEAPQLRHVTLGLIADDGHLLSRFPLPPKTDLAAIFGPPRKGALYRHLVASGFPQSGQMLGWNTVAAQDQVSVFERLAHFPVTMVVAIPQAEIREAWLRRTRAPLLLMAMVALFAWLGYRGLRQRQLAWDARRQRATRRLSRANSQLKLRKQQLLFELDEQRDAICRVGADGKVRFVNAAYCEAFGVVREDFVGTSWHSATLLEDVPQVEQDLARMTPETPLCTVEARMLMASGAVRWYQWSNKARFDADGQMLELQGVGRDISDRKALEGQHERALAELSDLYENSPQGLHSLAPDGVFSHINDTELAWLGRRREDVVGKLRWVDVCVPGSAAAFERNFKRFLAFGRVSDVEFTLLKTDGTTRRVSVTATAIRNEAGELLMSRSVIYDVEALRRSQQQADALTQQLAAMLDTELVAVVKLKNRRFQWINRGVTRLFGYTEAELDGQSTRILFASDSDFDAVGASYQKLLEGESVRVELPMVRKDGRPIWIDASGVLLSRESDEAMWVMVDITETRQLEAMRVKAAELAAESRHLQDSAQMKSMFMANLSHELRTPLNAVLGFAQLLQNGKPGCDNAKHAHYGAQIGNSGRKLLQLVESVLTVIQLEAGRLKFEPRPLSLGTLLHETRDLLQQDLAARGITVSIAVDAEVDIVELDPLRLQQVAFQYLSNAIKFSADGGTISVTVKPEPDEQFRLTVSDTGIGIAPEDLPRLFSDFQQLHEGYARAYPGLGLGLAMVRRLVEAQGGQVGVNSLPGVGSAFYAVLPRQAGLSAPAGPA